jgi:hypothetical protein
MTLSNLTSTENFLSEVYCMIILVSSNHFTNIVYNKKLLHLVTLFIVKFSFGNFISQNWKK